MSDVFVAIGEPLLSERKYKSFNVASNGVLTNYIYIQVDRILQLALFGQLQISVVVRSRNCGEVTDHCDIVTACGQLQENRLEEIEMADARMGEQAQNAETIDRVKAQEHGKHHEPDELRQVIGETHRRYVWVMSANVY